MTEDEQKPYLLPPMIYDPPPETHGVARRKFQGIPSLAVAPSGRLWVTWYAGKTPSEDHNNYVVLATSGNHGATWTERKIVDPDGDGPVRAFDPELWIDPSGRLWWFWTQSVGHDGKIAGVWTVTNDEPDRDDAVWSQPRRLADGVMMCKPIALSSGEWILPVSTWRETDNNAKAVVSMDQGETWEVRGACNVPKEVRSFDEHMVVEKMDGTVWMLVRTNQGIWESLSADRGQTWSDLKASSIQHTDSRFFICRLASGKLLLVKHGPILEKTGRSQLTAFTSADDGRSWSSGFLLDEREEISYPDGQQSEDGIIYIVYDRSRTREREILMSKFTEDDVRAEDMDRSRGGLRLVVSRCPA